VGEIDLQLMTASQFAELGNGESTAYVICLTFYQITDEEA
jgi:hypothetical protein